MVVLRDGEWSVWCRCGWRSPASSTPSQLTAGHPCGSGGTLATRGRQAATPIQGGDATGAKVMRTEHGSRCHLSVSCTCYDRADKCSSPPAPIPNNRAQGVDNPAALLLVRFGERVKSS